MNQIAGFFFWALDLRKGVLLVFSSLYYPSRLALSIRTTQRMNQPYKKGAKPAAGAHAKLSYRDSVQVKVSRFVDGFGTESGIFNYGFNIIKMRCHVWGIAHTVQVRMLGHWKTFAEGLGQQGVDRLSLMTPGAVIDTLKAITASASTSARSDDELLEQMRDLSFTVNNVFSVLQPLHWENIQYQQLNNIYHPWQRPAPPSSNDFYRAASLPQVEWLGKKYMVIVNSGCAATMAALGKDAIAHCYRSEMSQHWTNIYRSGWKLFEAWCKEPSTDTLTVQSICDFADWLVKQVEASTPVEHAIAALNVVNDTLARLRGPFWTRVPHRFSEEQVLAVPHPPQVPVTAIADLMQDLAQKKNSPNYLKIDDPSVRLQARSNYLLGTTMLLALQRVIKLRATQFKSGNGFDQNERRSAAIRTFCNSMSAKGVTHLSDLNSDHINAFINEQRLLHEQKAISDWEMKARVITNLTMLSSLKPLHLEVNALTDDFEYLESDWKAPEIPTEQEAEQMLQKFDAQEHLKANVLNYGYGVGIQSPLRRLVLAVLPDAFTETQLTSLTTTFSVFLKTVSITQLEQVRTHHVDEFIEEMEERVDDGETTADYADLMMKMLNSVLPLFIPGWRPRTFTAQSLPANLDPTKTSVDHFQARKPRHFRK